MEKSTITVGAHIQKKLALFKYKYGFKNYTEVIDILIKSYEFDNSA